MWVGDRTWRQNKIKYIKIGEYKKGTLEDRSIYICELLGR
jgi:hypothetical protein